MPLKSVDEDGPGGEIAVEHPVGALLQMAENGAGRGLDALCTRFETLTRRRGQRQIDGDVECPLLAGRQATLEMFGIGQRSREDRIGGTRALLQDACRAHADQLALEVFDYPRDW